MSLARPRTLIGRVATCCQQNVLASGRISFDGIMEVQGGGGGGDGVVTSRSTVTSLAKNSKYFSLEKKRTRRTGKRSRQRQKWFAMSSESGVSDSGGEWGRMQG